MAGRVVRISSRWGARSPMPAARGTPRDPSTVISSPPPPPRALTGLRLLGLEPAVTEPLAGSLGHIHPGVSLLVGLGCPGAGGIRRLTVVLPGFDEAVALLVLELRHRRGPSLGARQKRHGQRGNDSGGDQHASLVHGSKAPFGEWLLSEHPVWSRPRSPPVCRTVWKAPVFPNRSAYAARGNRTTGHRVRMI